MSITGSYRAAKIAFPEAVLYTSKKKFFRQISWVGHKICQLPYVKFYLAGQMGLPSQMSGSLVEEFNIACTSKSITTHS
jgi:hypothetical protein